MTQDWKLTNQQAYLHGKALLRREFRPYRGHDHAHCVFCWEKFGLDKNMLHSGFCTEDRHHWICETCFLDFWDQFEWTVAL